MLTKKITYTDYDGNERSEEFLFYLSKADLLEMQMSTPGGMEKMLKKIIEAQDTTKVYNVLKDIIMKSYGAKSDDGRRFVKSRQLSEEFSQTEAFSELMMELFSDQNAMVAFINGIIPQDVAQQIAARG